MNGPASNPQDAALLVAVAEASAWIALLHGPRRTPAAERGLQHWLAESALNKRAFEHATETWNATRGTVRRSARVDISVPGEEARGPGRPRWRVKLAAAAVVLIGVAATTYYLQRSAVSTAVGERRIVVLDDGTQVSLNTATRLVVRYNKQRREVQLESGEALFEVARHPDRPFVVAAGNREVMALGTAFLVRRDDRRLAVTLMEGKIAVAAAGTADPESPGADALTLAPGQRVVLTDHQLPMLDRPALEKLTAWQQGLVNIDNLTLAEAVAEMNRYGAVQLAVEGPGVGIRVSGVFRVTDSENLARAIALTHGLQLRKEGRRLVLSGTPQPPSESRFDPDLSELVKTQGG